MDPESRGALSHISEFRGVSWEEARQFCAKIRGYQKGLESSYVDISEALLWLERKGEPYSNRQLADQAAEITEAKRKDERQKKGSPSSGIVVEDSRIEKFEGPGQHQAFIDWVDHNSAKGFVLNLQSEESDPVLHTADCPHLRPDPKKDSVATTHIKLCSTSRKALKSKALNLAERRLELCQHCEV